MFNRILRDKFTGLVHGLDASSPDGHSWLNNAVRAIDMMADRGETRATQLRTELTDRTGYNSEKYRSGIEMFIHEVAKHGDLRMAHDNAISAAGLVTTNASRSSSSDNGLGAKMAQIVKNNFGK